MTRDEYLASLDAAAREEIAALDELIRAEIPSREPVVAHGMLGYGPFHYRYATGREGDSALITLGARKHGVSLYVLCTDEGAYLAEKFAARLGKVSVGKSCIRFRRVADVDLDVLRELLREADRIGPAAAV